jgi:hypothetical protein
MDDWFGNPFFQGGSPAFGDFHDHFAQIDRHMNDMMSSMFGGFRDANRHLGLDFDQPGGRRHSTVDPNPRSRGPRVEEVSDHDYGHHGGSSRPIVEEPDSPSHHDRSSRASADTRPRPRAGTTTEPYIYASAMSYTCGPGGVTHAKKKTYDSGTGRTEMAEMRGLGDQAVAARREIDRNGTVTNQFDRRNVEEADVAAFGERWQREARQQPRLRDARSGDLGRPAPSGRRALGYKH